MATIEIDTVLFESAVKGPGVGQYAHVGQTFASNRRLAGHGFATRVTLDPDAGLIRISRLDDHGKETLGEHDVVMVPLARAMRMEVSAAKVAPAK